MQEVIKVPIHKSRTALTVMLVPQEQELTVEDMQAGVDILLAGISTRLTVGQLQRMTAFLVQVMVDIETGKLPTG